MEAAEARGSNEGMEAVEGWGIPVTTGEVVGAWDILELQVVCHHSPKNSWERDAVAPSRLTGV